MKDIVIIGAGGFGKEVASFIEDINIVNDEWNIIGYIDDDKQIQGKELNGYKVLGTVNDLDKFDNIFYVCAIAKPKVRKRIISKIKNNIKAAIIIHPSAIINRKYSEIGEGSIICPNSVITVNTVIGKYNIIDYNSTIGHDNIINDFVTIYPGVNLSGNCKINSCVELGTGSKVIQGISIGKNTIVGAGSVVIKNIEDGITVVGVPSRIVLNNI